MNTPSVADLEALARREIDEAATEAKREINARFDALELEQSERISRLSPSPSEDPAHNDSASVSVRRGPRAS